MNVKEEDLVLCTVKKIEGTTVFLTIDGNHEGSMTLSEVSPGRIRNIREFINVGKKIVCKVLRVQDNRIELSLRRVTAKEREAILDEYEKERALLTMLKSVLKEKSSAVLEKIKEEMTCTDFIESAKENKDFLAKFVTKKEAEALLPLFAEKKDKEKKAKIIIVAKTSGEHGLYDLQQALSASNAEIHYLGSSRFSVAVSDNDFKHANAKLASILKELETRAKQNHITLEIKQ